MSDTLNRNVSIIFRDQDSKNVLFKVMYLCSFSYISQNRFSNVIFLVLSNKRLFLLLIH